MFGTTISGTVALVTLGEVITAANIPDDDQVSLGYVLACSTAIPCFLSSFCFYIAGTHYIEFKKALIQEKTAALVVAEEERIDMRSESIAELQYQYKAKRLGRQGTRGPSSTLPQKFSRPLPTD